MIGSAFPFVGALLSTGESSNVSAVVVYTGEAPYNAAIDTQKTKISKVKVVVVELRFINFLLRSVDERVNEEMSTNAKSEERE